MQATLPDAAQETVRLKAIERSKSKYPLLEEAHVARRPLTDIELGYGANGDGAGLSAETIAALRRWSKEHPGTNTVTIPNEAEVARVRDLGLATGKIENIKPKSMAEVELLLFGGRAEDKNMVVLRNLKLSEREVDAIVDRAVLSGKVAEEDRAVAHQIVKKRKKEWALFNARGAVDPETLQPILDPATGLPTYDDLGIGMLKAYDEAGYIPNQFRGTDNDLTLMGPKQRLRFELEYLDPAGKKTTPDASDYVVLLQEHPKTKQLVKITGDDDGIFIGLANGLGLPKSQLEAAYGSLMDVFNHPFSDTWLAAMNKKLEIFSRYFETIPGTAGKKGAPLVAFLDGEAYAVKINGTTTRFNAAANRAYIDFVGLPRAVDPIAQLLDWRAVLLRPLPKLPLPASFLRSFLQVPGGSTQHDAPIPAGKAARVTRLTADLAVETWTPQRGWQPDPQRRQRPPQARCQSRRTRSPSARPLLARSASRSSRRPTWTWRAHGSTSATRSCWTRADPTRRRRRSAPGRSSSRRR